MSKYAYEVLVGCAFVAISIAAYISINTTTGTSFSFNEESSMTSTTFPNFLAIGLGLMGAVFLLGSIRRLYAEGRISASFAKLIGNLWSRQAAITVALVVLLLAYANLIREVNFGVLTFGFLAIGFVLFGERKPLQICLVAAIGAACFYGLFVYVLQLPLNP